MHVPSVEDTGLRPLLWRLHFLGGFLAAPVVLSLALTGILFAWNPQIEAVLHREALTAVAAGPDRTLGEQVTAARETRPAWCDRRRADHRGDAEPAGWRSRRVRTRRRIGHRLRRSRLGAGDR